MGKPETRQRLVEAAADLFYEQGIHRTGVEQVIAHAGVSKPTLYQHFRSKEELVETVLDGWAARRQELLEEILGDPSREPRDRLLDVFRFFEGWVAGKGFRAAAWSMLPWKFPELGTAAAGSSPTTSSG